MTAQEISSPTRLLTGCLRLAGLPLRYFTAKTTIRMKTGAESSMIRMVKHRISVSTEAP